MKILALDLATNTGVAFGPAGSIPKCWTVRLGEAGEPHAARFAQALHMTHLLIADHKPDIIVVEKPIASGPKGGADRILVAGGLRGCVLGVARLRSVRPREYAVATVRKHFIGDAKLKRDEAKRAVMAECHRRGWAVENDNEGDAAALWDLALAREGFQVSAGGLFSEVET